MPKTSLKPPFAAGCSTASVFQFDELLPRKHEQLEPALESAEAASGIEQDAESIHFVPDANPNDALHRLDLAIGEVTYLKVSNH